MLEIQLHLKELKYRFFYILVSLLFIFIILSNYYSEVLYLIISPLGSHTLIYTEISELFWTILSINFLLTFYFSIPIIILQVWLFLIPGFYTYEKKRYFYIYTLCIIFFYFNTWIIFKYLISIFCTFFLSYAPNYNYLMTISLNAKISEYLSFFLLINFLFLISFIIPLLYIGLIKWNIITFKTFIFYKKFLYFLLLIFYAFITPPDIFTLLIFIVPIIIFLEIFIFLLFLYKNYKNTAVV